MCKCAAAAQAEQGLPCHGSLDGTAVIFPSSLGKPMVPGSPALLLQLFSTLGDRLVTSIMGTHHRIASIALGLLVSTAATALDINVVGLFPNKAVVQIEGGSLQTLSVGQKTRYDVTLVSVERDGATFDIQGQRVALALGHARTQTSSSAPDSVMVPADGRGHFVTDGQVNGLPIRFAVDTGATFVTLSARDASRLGLDYRKGRPALMETANGDVS